MIKFFILMVHQVPREISLQINIQNQQLLGLLGVQMQKLKHGMIGIKIKMDQPLLPGKKKKVLMMLGKNQQMLYNMIKTMLIGI